MARRVLHVIPAVAPRYGGPSTATFGICHALEAAGVETMVATTDADGPDRLPVETGSLQKYRGIRTIFFPRVMSEAFKWSGPLGSWLAANVGSFDLVHIHGVFSHSSVAAARACRRARVPYFGRPLGQLDPWSLSQHRWRKWLMLELSGRDMLRGASAMHYTSEAERSLAERLPGLPSGVVVPLGIDDACFRTSAGRRRDAPYVLALSRLHIKKGFELLIDAFHAVPIDGRRVPAALVLAGDSDDEPYVAGLKRRAASGPARDRISFHGWVTGDARQSLFEGASLFALPSAQENFGLAVAEAMAAGVPVMVSPEVNLSADIEARRAGWVVARDRDGWTTAITAALADDAELAQRGRRARQLAERFRWPVVGRALADAYDGVLQPWAEATLGRHPVPDVMS
jgi:glycosyltransferase involved in cell wall biosynthesis